jgi:hypothetical protein
MLTLARELLDQVKALCEGTGDRYDRSSAAVIQAALADSDERLMVFLVSNSLWGGAGSVADQACVSSNASRGQVEDLLIRLGRAQIESGATSIRTEGWVSAFEKWRNDGIRSRS